MPPTAGEPGGGLGPSFKEWIVGEILGCNGVAEGTRDVPGSGGARPIGRRRFLVGTLGAAVATLARPPAAGEAAARPMAAGIHGGNVALLRRAGGRARILRRYPAKVAGTSPYCFVRATGPDGRARVLAGCTGLTNQLQAFDGATGAMRAVASSVTTATQGVQECVYLPRTRSVLAVAGSRIHLVTSTMGASHVATLGGGATVGYRPCVDTAGRVWMGTYAKGGRGTFARFDPATRAVTMMRPIAKDTDYVRCVAVSGTTVWGGTGAIRPRLVSMSMSKPGVYRTYALPRAALYGHVTWICAWNDYVVVCYRETSGNYRVAVLNIATGRFVYLPHVAQGGSVIRNGTKLYYFSMTAIHSFDVKTGATATIRTGWTLRPLHVAKTAAGGRAKILVVARDPKNDTVHNLRLDAATGAEEARVRLGVRASAFRVHAIHSSRDGFVYAGGYQGNTLARINKTTGSVVRTPKTAPFRQIESMHDLNASTLIVGSYGGAEIVAYDRASGTSRSLAHLGKLYQQSRPMGMCAAAGRIVVGSVPDQGRQGGGLTVLNAQSGAVVRHVAALAGTHSIVGVCGWGNIAYCTTTRMPAYGAPLALGWGQVIAYNVSTNKVLWRTRLPGEGEINSPIRIGSYIYVSVANGIVRLRADNGRPFGSYRIYSGAPPRATARRASPTIQGRRPSCMPAAGSFGRSTCPPGPVGSWPRAATPSPWSAPTAGSSRSAGRWTSRNSASPCQRPERNASKCPICETDCPPSGQPLNLDA